MYTRKLLVGSHKTTILCNPRIFTLYETEYQERGRELCIEKEGLVMRRRGGEYNFPNHLPCKGKEEPEMLHTFSAGGKAKKIRQQRSQSRAQESNPRNRLRQPMSPGGSVRQIRFSYRLLASLKGLQIRIIVACPSKDNVYWPSMKPGRAGNIFDTMQRRRVQERWYYYTNPPLYWIRKYSTLADMVIAAGLSCTEAELMNKFVEVSGYNLESFILSVGGFGSVSVSVWIRIILVLDPHPHQH
jgi:hypothetical protein